MEEYFDRMVQEIDEIDEYWKIISRDVDIVSSTVEAITIKYCYGGMARWGTQTVFKYGENIYIFDITAGVQCDFAGIREMDAYYHAISSFQFD